MRLIKFAILFLFLSFGSAQTSWSQSPSKQSPADAAMKLTQEIGQWAQSYYTVVDHLMPLFMNEHVDQAILALETEDEELLRKSAANYSEHRRNVLKAMKSSMASIPPVPKLSMLGSRGRKIEGAFETQMAQLSVMYNEAAAASGYVDTLFSRSAKDNLAGLDEIYKQQILATIRLAEAEIVQSDASLLAIPDTNPNYAFQQIVRAHNYIVIEELRMELMTYNGPTMLKDRQSHVREIGKQLDIISKNLVIGPQNLKKTNTDFDQMIASVSKPEERAFMTHIRNALATFGKQFEVEKDMYGWARKSHSVYAAEGPSDAYESDIDTNDNAIIELQQKRFDIMSERAQMIAK